MSLPLHRSWLIFCTRTFFNKIPLFLHKKKHNNNNNNFEFFFEKKIILMFFVKKIILLIQTSYQYIFIK